MFLTPDGEPFWGGTYFPPEPRWGRAGFPQILATIAAAYRDKRDDVAKNVAALREGLERLGRPQPRGGIEPDRFDDIARPLLREVHPLNGGPRPAPEYPANAIVAVLLAPWQSPRPGTHP